MEWADDVQNRPRRANAGNRLQELLQNGLDDEDEQDLRQLDHSSSDTSFTLGSDEETIDEVDSDFDAEEVAGVLEGETVETEATVRRAERQARQLEKKRALQRTQNFSKAAAHDRAMEKHWQQRQREKAEARRQRKRERTNRSDTASDATSDESDEEEEAASMDLRQRVRRRPAPRMACAQRLAEAQARAAARRAARAAARRAAQAAALAEESGDGAGVEGGVTSMLNMHRGLNLGKAKPRARRSAASRRAGASAEDATTAFSSSTSVQPVPFVVAPRVALYDCGVQRVQYSSGVSVLERYGVPTVITFAEQLPPVFQR